MFPHRVDPLQEVLQPPLSSRKVTFMIEKLYRLLDTTPSHSEMERSLVINPCVNFSSISEACAFLPPPGSSRHLVKTKVSFRFASSNPVSTFSHAKPSTCFSVAMLCHVRYNQRHKMLRQMTLTSFLQVVISPWKMLQLVNSRLQLMNSEVAPRDLYQSLLVIECTNM